ncbi:2-phospho-L-lactate guanylyltransferase [Kineococcus sp. SYSU DK004]|uniref:2-phospho-L-lactate guanylyltransferase n=1 Tax=Kineococcus sp. SYSU DK004 TaxID=3383125 RepID=UPI003D7D7CD7
MVASGRWRVVVPVKGGDGAKSRLGLPVAERRALATAMALDCLTAALAAPPVALVVCVTDDPDVAAAARGAGAAVVAAGGPGLHRAVEAGLAAVGTGPTAVLVADLPALRPDDLALALTGAAARTGPVLVTDAEGTGSVLVADRAGHPPHRFGPGSARAHAEAGAAPLPGALPSLRRDVDVPADLEAARALGVGPRTRAALRAATATAPTTTPTTATAPACR